MKTALAVLGGIALIVIAIVVIFVLFVPRNMM